MAKAPGKAVGHRRPAEPVRVSMVGEQREPPKPPPGMLTATRRAWSVYWDSGLAALAVETDLPAITRLFRKRDELERVEKVVREARLVKGSMGQVRVNPLADYAAKLEAGILKLETEFGLTIMSRMRLGIAVGDAQKTLEELNDRFNGDDDPSEDDAERPADPRAALALVQLTGPDPGRTAAS